MENLKILRSMFSFVFLKFYFAFFRTDFPMEDEVENSETLGSAYSYNLEWHIFVTKL